MLTSEPGASEFLLLDAVTYANSAKQAVLGVDEDVLRAHGAVSAEVAAAMAEGVRRVSGASIALSLTGVAGPDEQDGRPAGTLCVGIALPDAVRAHTFHLPGQRDQMRQMSVITALDLLRRVLLGVA